MVQHPGIHLESLTLSAFREGASAKWGLRFRRTSGKPVDIRHLPAKTLLKQIREMSWAIYLRYAYDVSGLIAAHVSHRSE